MEQKLTNLILHGHFYQPPRENPSTGLIPKQASALPYEDWNERICAECYKANVNSRYLSQNGRIISLTNNFEYISYNFGPTLLSWLETYQGEVYEKILDSDKKSIKRLGHGNAIAQGYNHTILPLDKEKDAKIQIDWGIEDFKYRFNRDPEGMWLPEAAINGKIIDLLSSFGIKFVILSPWQCKSIENPDGSMTELNGRPAPYGQSYTLTGPLGGTVSAFFYEPSLASDISFGHALQSADSLYQKLLNLKNANDVSLIHTATDGEIYGHHEPFGDMALAALIHKTRENEDFVMTNYATVLEQNPTTLHATLLDGEEGKGTSWSCSHGVSRWYKNCGCHTGGDSSWNQKWRTPLRNALVNNANRLDSIFNNHVRKIFNDNLSPDTLLHLASGAIIEKTPMSEFIKDLHTKYKFDPLHDSDLANLIIGMKNKHFSFTSCGFFFSDISGIEPQQDIKYALYAINLYQKYYMDDLLFPFLSDLKDAQSNIKSEGTGMSIAQAQLNCLSGEVEAALYFYLNTKMVELLAKETKYGRFKLLELRNIEDYVYLEIIDTTNLMRHQYNILSSSSIELGLNLYFSNASDNNSKNIIKITTKNIPDRMIDIVSSWLLINYKIPSFDSFRLTADNILNYSLITSANRFFANDGLQSENINRSMRLIKGFLNLFDYDTLSLRLCYVERMINFIKSIGKAKDIERVRSIITKRFDNLASSIKPNGIIKENLTEIVELIKLTRNLSIDPDLRNIQNVIYGYYTQELKSELLDAQDLALLFDYLNFQ